MYTSDLAEWLWTILLNGKPNSTYNVGSDVPVTVGELATEIAFKTGAGVIFNRDPNVPSTVYVPDTTITRAELGLMVKVSRSLALDNTIEWWRHANRR
jgi:nucleoside-diphosphate-sugar epimerase